MGVWKFCCVLPIGMGRKAHSTRHFMFQITGADLGEGAGGVHTPPPCEMTCSFLIQLVLCKKKTIWFIAVEVEQETSAPTPKKNPGYAPELGVGQGGTLTNFLSNIMQIALSQHRKQLIT